MNTTDKLAVLTKIAREFAQAGITWALGASMLLYFKGITPDFHDIDLMVANDDADAARDILARLGCQLPPNPNAKYRTKCFLEFVIDGVDVDMMAGFAIVSDGVLHDCSLQREEIVETLTLAGARIPLQSIARWQEYYAWMGRQDKVRMIGAYLERSALS